MKAAAEKFFREHFDLRTDEWGVTSCYHKTWEARDCTRGTYDLFVLEDTPSFLALTNQQLAEIIPLFFDDYRFNTRKHPKRGVTTHASVNI